jgi:hypothetical protein
MTEEIKNSQQPENLQKPVEKKEKIEEFSLKWHIKVLTVIYVILAVFYLVLKFTLK